MDVTTYVLLKKLIEEGGGSSAAEIEAIKQSIAELKTDKMNIIGYIVKGGGIITQEDANAIIDAYTLYDGSMINFLSNTESPNKSIAYGWVGMDKDANKYLLEFNNGIMTKWDVTQGVQMSVSKNYVDSEIKAAIGNALKEAY